MSQPVRIFLMGLGHVARALLRGFDAVERAGGKLVAAADSRGIFSAEAGLRAAEVLERKEQGQYDAPRAGSTGADLVANVRPDVLVELTPTDLVTGEPAISDLRRALELGASVVTATKSHQRSAACMRALDDLAAARGAHLLDHAATLAGIPVTEMKVGMGFTVVRLEGVLNGTTNYVLSRLAEGVEMPEALDEAIRKGYAERDPRYDVEGPDVAVKLVGLARRLFGVLMDVQDVELRGSHPGVLGIAGIGSREVRALLAEGKKVKLFGEMARGAGGSVRAAVYPRTFGVNEPFGRLDGFHNAVRIVGTMNGTEMELFLQGPGAGADETASRVLGNILHLLGPLGWRGHGGAAPAAASAPATVRVPR